jgi:hypothetical protein
MTLMWAAALAEDSVVYQQAPEATAKKHIRLTEITLGHPQKWTDLPGFQGIRGLLTRVNTHSRN